MLTPFVASPSGAGPSSHAPVAPATDLLGSWSCSLSPLSVSGICPKGPRQSGTCEICNSGDAFTLEYTSGFRCSPKAACSLELAVGPAKAVAETARPISGTGRSSYTGPGMLCQWATSLTLTRPVTRTKPR